MAITPENMRVPVEQIDSRNQKPKGYLDIGGKEKNLPSVQAISRALRDRSTFTVVGGGDSGKTESMMTALDLENKAYEFFDLQKWTVAHLARKEIVLECLEDPQLGDEARTYLTALRGSFNLIDDNPKSTVDEKLKAKVSLVNNDYYEDETLGIKYAEAYLLEIQLEKAMLGLALSDGVTTDANENNTLKRIVNSKSDIVILDGIDLGIGRKLSSVEKDTAKKLIRFATLLTDKQIGVIIHPPAREDDDFMGEIAPALAAKGKPSEINMKYFPRDIEEAVLGLVGITGSLAQEFMSDVQGLPSAYLALCTDLGLREEFLRLSLQERHEKLRSMTELTVANNKWFIFDKASSEIQNALSEIINGARFDTGHPLYDHLARTMYVDAREGELVMPPVVKRVLGNLVDSETR